MILHATASGNTQVVKHALRLCNNDDLKTLNLLGGEFKENSSSPLRCAIKDTTRRRKNYKLLRVFLRDNRVDVNSPIEESGMTLLHWAMWFKFRELAVLLLQHRKLDMDARSANGYTAIEWAEQSGFAEGTRLLDGTAQLNVITIGDVSVPVSPYHVNEQPHSMQSIPASPYRK